MNEQHLASPIPTGTHRPATSSRLRASVPSASSAVRDRGRSARRGVLLLVVLSLLFMFVLIAVTYVLVATRHLAVSRQYARAARGGTGGGAVNTQKLLDEAMLQLVRGAKPVADSTGFERYRSVIGPHSLLEDLYGDSTKWTITSFNNPPTTAGGQLLEFTAEPDPPTASGGFTPRRDNGFYAGLVLTMTAGKHKGLSTRIVWSGTEPSPSNPSATPTPADQIAFRVLPFRTDSGATVIFTTQDTFVINGRAFAGTGFGYNRATGRPDAMYDFDNNQSTRDSVPWAFLPNPLSYDPLSGGYRWASVADGSNDYLLWNSYAPDATLYGDFAPNNVPPFGGPGGANEDYDAVDYQNMALAYVPAVSALTADQIKPSFHRPEMVKYFVNLATSSNPDLQNLWSTPASNLQLRRQIMLRPMGKTVINGTQYQLATEVDHPNFTGSNEGPATLPGFFDPVNGPWDIDNDGDGITDSIWLDLGMPVQTAGDGRLYKPLFAILCIDLDGRINVNAHGNAAQATAAFKQDVTLQLATAGGPPLAPDAGGAQPIVPIGSGFGPAEIYPGKVGGTNPQQFLERLFWGDGGEWEGRYGNSPTAGSHSAPRVGLPNTNDLASELHLFQYPQDDYLSQTTVFMTPGDVWGRRVVGIDYRGQLAFDAPVPNTDPDYANYSSNETLDDPYEIDLSRRGSRPGAGARATTALDNPFTIYELERLLRPFDIDATGLAPRLAHLTSVASNPLLRLQLTTESYDIPMPPPIVPVEMRDELNTASVSTYLRNQYKRAFHVQDLFLARLSDVGGITGAAAEAELDRMLAWELRSGRRMNINRPLGDGRDSDGINYATAGVGTAYVVDEPTVSEVSAEGQTGPSPWVTRYPGAPFDLANGIDVDGDGAVDQTDQLMARQLMARHLYVLMMLVHNSGFDTDANWMGMQGSLGNDPEVHPTTKRELVARRIAQWAVNVVDFMDPDSIMTPFEYDMRPFEATGTIYSGRTWEVDGKIDDGMGISNDDDPTTNMDRRLVWGCEAPALLLTETLAFHDRRVADTPTGQKRDTTGDDDDLDQVLIPQGSAFFELYSVANPNTPTQPGDLYTLQGGVWYLDLARMAPPGDDGLNNNVSYPVWRLAISQPNSELPRTPRLYAAGRPETVSFEPQQGLPTAHPMAISLAATVRFNVLNSPAESISPKIERIVWFGNAAPAAGLRDGTSVEIYYGKQYFNPYVNNTALLPSGSYAVVGPRPITAIGSMYESTATQKWGVPSNHRIRLDSATVSQDLITNAQYPPNTSVKQAVGIVAQADALAGWTGPPIGVSVSEPLPGAYYLLQPDGPPNSANPNAAAGYGGYAQEAYGDLSGAGSDFEDAPFEEKSDSTLPLEKMVPNQTNTGTTLDYRTVFLQRLANPLAHYHPKTNPYLTVDWMPIDLTVFNGEDHIENDNSNGLPVATWDPDDSNPDAAANNRIAFASRQRGQHSSFSLTPAANSTDNTRYALWSQWHDAPSVLTVGGEPPGWVAATPGPLPEPRRNFRLDLDANPSVLANRTTLGYLNHGYGEPLTSADLSSLDPTLQAVYLGDPKQPFPLVTWNNRPYTSVYELLQVPASSADRLYWESSIVLPGSNTNPYNNLPQTPTYTQFPFRHLLNFLASGNAALPSTQYANVCRILDYVEVPSPFVGTETVLNPGAMARTNPGTDYLHPPFGSVSEFRDPGRVNINTIASQQVWEAVAGPGSLDWTDFEKIRKGFLSGNPLDYPMEFANPFRSYSAGDMVPRLEVPLSGGGGSDVDALRRRPSTAGLLRPGRTLGGAVSSLDDPDDDKNATSPTVLPALMDPTTVAAPAPAYKDATRNSYFMYQGLDRLANLVTTRSNVYAMWVTVGYFEVTPQQRIAPFGQPNTVYPDGYELGQELGTDTGDIQRHRAFYIIDRSIPVGFERGQNHNVEDAVLLRRFIE